MFEHILQLFLLKCIYKLCYYFLKYITISVFEREEQGLTKGQNSLNLWILILMSDLSHTFIMLLESEGGLFSLGMLHSQGNEVFRVFNTILECPLSIQHLDMAIITVMKDSAGQNSLCPGGKQDQHQVYHGFSQCCKNNGLWHLYKILLQSCIYLCYCYPAYI